MKKLAVYSILPLIVAALVVADYAILTRTSAIRQIVERELRKAFADDVAFDALDLGDGNREITLHNVRLAPRDNGRISSKSVTIRFRDPLTESENPVVEEVVLDVPELVIEDRFVAKIKELVSRKKGGAERSLPAIRVHGGEAIVETPALTEESWVRRFAIVEWDLLPRSASVYDLHARLKSALFGEWTVDGVVELRSGKVEIRCRNDDFAISEDLYNAFGAAAREALERYAPVGHCAVDLGILLSGDRKTSFSAVVHCKGMSACYRSFPYAMEEIVGEIFFGEEGFAIPYLDCSAGGGRFSINGSGDGYDGESGYAVNIVGRNVAVDDKLKNAIPAKTREAIGRFSPTGRVSFQWTSVKRRGENGVRDRIAVDLEDVSVAYDLFPLPITHASGRALFEGDRLDIHAVRGEYGNGGITVDGAVHDPGGRSEKFHLTVAVESLFVNDAVRAAAPPQLREILRKVDFVGIVDGKVSVVTSRDEREATAQYSANMKVLKARIKSGFVLDDIDGLVGVSVEQKGESVAVGGNVNIFNCLLNGIPLLNAGIGFDAAGNELNIRKFQASLCGGSLSGEAQIIPGGNRFSAQLKASNIDLGEFAKAVRMKSRELAGRADVEVKEIAGTLDDCSALTGEGHVAFRDIFLWDVPIFFNMINLKIFTFDTKPVFHRGGLDIKIGGGSAHLSDMKFDGESLHFVGKGTVGLDGKLNLVIYSKTKTIISDIPGVNLLEGAIDLVKDTIYAVEITGTFDKPEHSAKLLPSILSDEKR